MALDGDGHPAVKPLDVGNGIACASVTAHGDLLSLGTCHARHGFVELNALPVFDERQRGDPDATRAYRLLMLDPRYAFLMVEPVDGRAQRTVETWAPPGAAAIIQRHNFRAEGRPPRAIRATVRGRLDRPALAEITETDPPPPTGAETLLETRGDELVLRAAALPATAVVTAPGAGATWTIDEERGVLELPWPRASGSMSLELRCAFEAIGQSVPSEAAPREHAPAVRASGQPGCLIVPPELAAGIERIATAALAYTVGCTALRVAHHRRVILTDHRILPLSWTRDAYFQALLLLASGDRVAEEIVADHLRWLWIDCERPDGSWARSHHADGRRKDRVFQVDQQLYPLLELADLWRATGSLPELPRGAPDWGNLVGATWKAISMHADEHGLLPTAENAADDPVSHPFLLSSQILGWYAAERVAELDEVLGIEAQPLRETGRRLRDGVMARFRVWTSSSAPLAYAIDAAGNHDRYYDANDLPLALAPAWGFCAAGDPAWQATMTYAFSEANPAYVAGRHGGIGSRHTPGCWTLGDIQEWIFGSLADDAARAERALERLLLVAAPDGHLPETYDPETGRTVARHWFAWPGAALGALWQLDARGLFFDRLGTRQAGS